MKEEEEEEEEEQLTCPNDCFFQKFFRRQRLVWLKSLVFGEEREWKGREAAVLCRKYNVKVVEKTSCGKDDKLLCCAMLY